jgi:hypothetical protein
MIFNIEKIHWETSDEQLKEDQEFYRKKGWMNDPVPEHPYRFRAYDDDGNLYFTGTINDGEWDLEDTLDTFMWDAGVTELKIYDRKTNKYIDTLC